MSHRCLHKPPTLHVPLHEPQCCTGVCTSCKLCTNICTSPQHRTSACTSPKCRTRVCTSPKLCTDICTSPRRCTCICTSPSAAQAFAQAPTVTQPSPPRGGQGSGAGPAPLKPAAPSSPPFLRSHDPPSPAMPLHFAPLRLPLRRRLQTAAVLQWVCSFLALGQLCAVLFALALRGSLWLPALLYGLWLLADRDTPRRGGRRSAWVRGWPLWTYFRDYFPISLVRTTELDPRRNYIFGFHPHGVLAAGAFANFCTEATGFGVLFPGLRPHLLTLPCWFRLPLFRDYMMSGGLVSSEKSSLEYLLSREGGGQVAVIALGGPPESLDAHPGALTLQLLGRKGFVRIALEHGASLVPVFSFGENELFRQIPNPPGSGLRQFQLRLQRIWGWPSPFFTLGGVFQYSFGLLPFPPTHPHRR
ncbi:2-acylglycerol O-acyltransferase 2-B-like isoform X2 [Harpia harpyja]|uniref:2-acylglycerol O-acyltransferase 2-B-like isoform X2 n=1 Tax=Harpia harpyja TaxID=202280 RepID=UPI0022B0E3D0|nr:2-acylglycerol O-acyltransferase 2-B-like isoform X2 [Harpia harpyja]